MVTRIPTRRSLLLGTSGAGVTTLTGGSVPKVDIDFISDAGFAVYATLADATAAFIPLKTDIIRLLGYKRPGDHGRDAVYKSVAARPVHALKFRSANDRWFEYVPDSRGVSAGAAGVKADFMIDDWRAGQNAIDAATYVYRCPVYFPPGRIKHSNPFFLGYGDAFLQTTLEGAGPRFRGDATESGTSFHATYKEGPGIALQGQRKAIVRGITLVGQNGRWIADKALGKRMGADVPLLDETAYANWIDPSFPASASSRYAPYAAVAIDPYSGKRPAVSYPDVHYPTWTGIVTQYGKLPSSDLVFEDCYFCGWIVGAAITPSDWDANSDFVRFVRCDFDACADMLSVGATQMRNLDLDACVFNTCHTLITTSRHGRQLGTLAGMARNCGIGETINLLDVAQPPYAGPFTFKDCYGEALWSLGRWGGSFSGNNPLVFEGGKFSFDLQAPARGFPLRMLAAGVPTPISVRDVSFSNYHSVMSFGGEAEGYIFENCEGLPTGEDKAVLAEYQKLAKNFLASGFALPPSISRPWPDRFSAKGYRYDLGSSGLGGSDKVREVMRSSRNRPAPAVAQQLFPADQINQRYQVPCLWSAMDKGAGIKRFTRSGTTLEVQFIARSEGTFMRNGGLPGDVLVETTGEVYFVRSRRGDVILAELQNGFKTIGGKTTYANPLTNSGTLYIGNSRVFTPAYLLQGDISEASPRVTNAGRADGYGSFIMKEVQVGDYAYVDDQADRWIDPEHARVEARDEHSITFAANCLKTQIGRGFALWIRQPPYNT